MAAVIFIAVAADTILAVSPLHANCPQLLSVGLATGFRHHGDLEVLGGVVTTDLGLVKRQEGRVGNLEALVLLRLTLAWLKDKVVLLVLRLWCCYH